jgi:hypothetical protein
MRVTESVTYSAVRWAVQPVPYSANGSGGHYPLPERMEHDYEFAPRVDGIAVDGLAGGGKANNVQIFRVNFTFGEILPNYPPPA